MVSVKNIGRSSVCFRTKLTDRVVLIKPLDKAFMLLSAEEIEAEIKGFNPLFTGSDGKGNGAVLVINDNELREKLLGKKLQRVLDGGYTKELLKCDVKEIPAKLKKDLSERSELIQFRQTWNNYDKKTETKGKIDAVEDFLKK
jgi:hypothetical protein